MVPFPISSHLFLENSQKLEQTTKFFLNPRFSIVSFSKEIKFVVRKEMAGFSLTSTACRQLSLMLFAVAFFHISEYVLAIAIHGRSRVPLSSLLISKHYLFAMGFSLLEYALEIGLIPQMKEYWLISNIGIVLVVIGELIRKCAIVTAGRAFTHMIRICHHEDHKLVKHGIYRFIRHPGYSGFFIWAIGIQIMLCNPLSTLAFMLVLWRFFSKRIRYEEYFLRQFFGSHYEEYAEQVSSGIPFVK